MSKYTISKNTMYLIMLVTFFLFFFSPDMFDYVTGVRKSTSKDGSLLPQITEVFWLKTKEGFAEFFSPSPIKLVYGFFWRKKNAEEKPYKIDWVELEKQITPCLTYDQQEGEYKVRYGDRPNMLFGLPYAKPYFQRNGIRRFKDLKAGDTLSFDYVNVQNLGDIKHVWETLDSLWKTTVDTLVLVIRDEGEIYLIIRGKEIETSDTVIWSTIVSTGRKHRDGRGMPTPTGFFQIVQRSIKRGRPKHWSKPYQCWMYYAQRLGFMPDTTEKYIYRTYWSPWLLHQGYTTGKPQSHGCIRMPKVWAVALWDLTPIGTHVLVLDRNQLYEKDRLIALWEKTMRLRHRYAKRKRNRSKKAA